MITYTIYDFMQKVRSVLVYTYTDKSFEEQNECLKKEYNELLNIISEKIKWYDFELDWSQKIKETKIELEYLTTRFQSIECLQLYFKTEKLEKEYETNYQYYLKTKEEQRNNERLKFNKLLNGEMSYYIINRIVI